MGFLDELKKLTKPYDDEDDYFDDDGYEDEAPEYDRKERRAAPQEEPDSYTPAAREPYAAPSPSGRVVNISAATKLQVVLVRPESYDSVGEIADHLRDRKAVLLNLEQTEMTVSRRLVDFLSGCAYALDGKIKKVATSTYLVTPFGVEISGEIIGELEDNGMYY